jgi:pyruvate/oxaloacetate carboxyltransferase
MKLRAIIIAPLIFITTGISNAEELVARVYGQAIYRSDISISKADIDKWRGIKTENEIKETIKQVERIRLSQIIFDSAYSNVLGENSYKPTEQEIESLLKALPESKVIIDIKSKMTTDQLKTADENRYKMAHQIVRSWKINKRLYEKYVGRIAYQQAGLESIDAYILFLNEIVKNGKVEIMISEFRSILTPTINIENQKFMSVKDAKRAFEKPWWENKK